jgi:glycerate kinase
MEKILVAPTAFKGTLSPVTVANAIALGIQRNTKLAGKVQTLQVPLADGGDGTVECVNVAAGGHMRHIPVLMHEVQRVNAQWLELNNEALVELASACGIAHFKVLQPMTSNTHGLGQVIKRAYDIGFRHINIAVGGSASTDGGAGALQALGARFFYSTGQEIANVNGKTLSEVSRIDLSALATMCKHAQFRLLTDVESPLYGPQGAAFVFAPQKGANNEQVHLLEKNLKHYADVLEKTTGRHFRDEPGTGAAGGTAFGLACALGARIESGFQWISEITDLRKKIAESSLVITGEGRFDSQSVKGKVIGELIKLCNQYGKKLWVVAASVELANGQTPEGVDRIIVAEQTQGLCTQSDLSRSIQHSAALHDFFTMRP